MTTAEHLPQRRTYSVSEAAAVLGISRAKAYECVRTGELPSVRFGRRIVVPTAALERLLGSGRSADLVLPDSSRRER